ncbi:hypothetical protein MKW92_022033 [Papaver armeniacum]|nr:hypothetical protein MKW92_022033 [Papaver armeniacum]
MVKTVVGEETQLKLVEDRVFQSGISAQVGIVIGKISSSIDRGFVFDLIPTPPNDGGQPACYISESKDDNSNKKKGSAKGKSQTQLDSSSPTSSLVIDSDWVAEHARQVSRMLLGGMHVVGVYVWASEISFKNSTLKLWQTVKEVAQAAASFENGLDERLLIHISYSPRRWTCRNCSVGSTMTSNSLRPCDFKMGRVLASLQTFRCMYNFDIRLPIYRENLSKANTLTDILHNGISRHAKELKKRNQKEVLGVVAYQGSACSYAYLSPREPISQAVADIKTDILTSLKSRLAIISDEGEEDMDSTAEAGRDSNAEISTEKSISKLDLNLLRKSCILAFPRRVLVPWVGGAFICDYLQPSETFQVLEDNFKELMSMEAPIDVSKIIKAETEATSLKIKSFWDAVISNPSTSRSIQQKEASREPVKSTTFNIVIPIIVLLVAMLLGFFLFVRDPKAHSPVV